MSDFALKRLHSLLGIFPIGVFVLQHYFSNSYALISPEAFNEHSAFLLSFPMVIVIELTSIYIPIIAHIILGLMITYRGKNNVAQYPTYRNWMYFLQRLTGIMTAAFVVVHTYTTRISHLISGEDYLFADMSETLSNPWWFLFYALGMMSTSFHLCNGAWSFLITWGITVSEKSQKAASLMAMLGFVLMTAWGFTFMVAFVK